MEEKLNPLRMVFLGLIGLPLFLFMLESVGQIITGSSSENPFVSLFGSALFPASWFLIALIVSVIGFGLSRFWKNELFIKGEIPADTSMFLSDLLLFPFIFLYPPNATFAIQGIFIPLEVGLIIVASIFVILISPFKPKDFPKRDNRSVFLLYVALCIISAITAILSFGFLQYTSIAYLISYISIFANFSLIIYGVQLIANKEGFNLSQLSV